MAGSSNVIPFPQRPGMPPSSAAGTPQQARHGAGSSRGGQFAATQRPEAPMGAGGIDLSADPGADLMDTGAPAEPSPFDMTPEGGWPMLDDDLPELPSAEPSLTPQGRAVLDSAPYGARHVGERYTGNDVAEISKAVRTATKRMQKEGLVPADWKVSVRSERFAGGQAINIAITGDIPHEDFYIPSYDETRQRPTAEAALAIGRIEEELQSYNYDRSESQIDYFDVHFYGNVSVNDRSGSRWSEDVCPTCVAYRPCSC